MPHDDLKTKWSPKMGAAQQLQTLFSALLTRIGLPNIRGIAVFVRYEGEDAGGKTEVQNAIFTGGEEVDFVYDWVKESVRASES